MARRTLATTEDLTAARRETAEWRTRLREAEEEHERVVGARGRRSDARVVQAVARAERAEGRIAELERRARAPGRPAVSAPAAVMLPARAGQTVAGRVAMIRPVADTGFVERKSGAHSLAYSHVVGRNGTYQSQRVAIV